MVKPYNVWGKKVTEIVSDEVTVAGDQVLLWAFHKIPENLLEKRYSARFLASRIFRKKRILWASLRWNMPRKQ